MGNQCGCGDKASEQGQIHVDDRKQQRHGADDAGFDNFEQGGARITAHGGKRDVRSALPEDGGSGSSQHAPNPTFATLLSQV
jgi:hypothetical protein